MSKIDAYLDGKYFNTYWGDGVIITSPIGSTGYNMSAMGPIIYPLSDVFVSRQFVLIVLLKDRYFCQNNTLLVLKIAFQMI